MKDYTKFVGLDVSKDSISVAVADTGRGEPRFLCLRAKILKHTLFQRAHYILSLRLIVKDVKSPSLTITSQKNL